MLSQGPTSQLSGLVPNPTVSQSPVTSHSCRVPFHSFSFLASSHSSPAHPTAEGPRTLVVQCVPELTVPELAVRELFGPFCRTEKSSFHRILNFTRTRHVSSMPKAHACSKLRSGAKIFVPNRPKMFLHSFDIDRCSKLCAKIRFRSF